MLQRPIKHSALDRDRGGATWFEDVEIVDPEPTQEEILRNVGLLLAIALGFAAIVGAIFIGG